jgi:hypothetical protein
MQNAELRNQGDDYERAFFTMAVKIDTISFASVISELSLALETSSHATSNLSQ